MKNKIPVFLIVSLLFASLCYLLTSNFFLTFSVFAIHALVLCFLVNPLVVSYQDKMRKKQESYRFINSFIVSLSASNSLETAFENASIGLSGEEKEVLAETSKMRIDERLDYLAKYFPDDVYKVFVSIIRLFEEQGGEILDVAGPLMKESTLAEEERIESLKNAKQALIQFSSLWFMSALVMAVLRFGLSSFYANLVGNVGFLMMCFSYFCLSAVSFFLFALGVTKEKVRWKGGNYHVFKKKKQND